MEAGRNQRGTGNAALREQQARFRSAASYGGQEPGLGRLSRAEAAGPKCLIKISYWKDTLIFIVHQSL